MALTAMWLQGLESALPAAGVASRLYFATDTGRIFVDSGSAWARNNLVHRGTYAGGTTYYEKDLVTYNGSVWKALATVTGVTPVEGANWTLFVAKGDTGAAGSGIASIDGVSNNAGNVDLIAGTNVTITPDDTANTITIAASGGGASAPFSDATALVKDDADNTKLIRVDAGTVATGTTRVLTMPNADVNLGALTNSNIDAAAAIAESKLNLASDAAAGTASRRTLGTGATQAAAGNHAHAHSALTGIDTDTATTAIHHTLGTGANQAAAGNHSHTITNYETVYWTFKGTAAATTGVLRVPVIATATIVKAWATANTAPTGAGIVFDINYDGTTIWTSGKLTIAASGTSATTTTFTTTAVTVDHYLTCDIDSVGSTIAGADIVVALRYSY